MDEQRLVRSLTGLLDPALAHDLVSHYIKIRQDCVTRTFERASPGKFVETLVQSLQSISRGSYDAKPDVDAFLNSRIENEETLPDGIRFCVGRVARAMYTLRNKRNIAHNGEVDPNSMDIIFLHQAATWIMAEMIRCSSGVTMEEAGGIIRMIQVPLGTLVEEIDGIRLVHAQVSVRSEILILMHSYYPDHVELQHILNSLISRDSAYVRRCLNELKANKIIVGENTTGYKLTTAGHSAAVAEITNLQAN